MYDIGAHLYIVYLISYKSFLEERAHCIVRNVQNEVRSLELFVYSLNFVTLFMGMYCSSHFWIMALSRLWSNYHFGERML